MKVAIIGSRGAETDDIEDFLPDSTDEIISGGAIGIDTCAKRYAKEKGLKYTEFLPQYAVYGRAAPIVRNKLIVERADAVIAFWDGKSKGTKNVIDLCKEKGITCRIVLKK